MEPGAVVGSSLSAAPFSTTIYTVQGTDQACTSTATVQLAVNPLPTLVCSASSTALCAGESVTLHVGGANTYTWNPGQLQVVNAVVSPTATQQYTVIGSNGLCASSQTLSLSVYTVAVSIASDHTLACKGENITLTASGAQSYSWSGGQQSAGVIVSPTLNTLYSVIGSDSHNCQATANILQQISDCIGIEERQREGDHYRVYPNPTTGRFLIHGIYEQGLLVEVYNSLGQKTLDLEVKDQQDAIDLRGYSYGVYIILIRKSGRCVAQIKLIKE